MWFEKILKKCQKFSWKYSLKICVNLNFLRTLLIKLKITKISVVLQKCKLYSQYCTIRFNIIKSMYSYGKINHNKKHVYYRRRVPQGPYRDVYRDPSQMDLRHRACLQMLLYFIQSRFEVVLVYFINEIKLNK